MTALIIGIVVLLACALLAIVFGIKGNEDVAGISILAGILWFFFYNFSFGLLVSEFYPKVEKIKPEIVTTKNFKMVIYGDVKVEYTNAEDYNNIDSTTTFYLVKTYNMYGCSEKNTIIYLK